MCSSPARTPKLQLTAEQPSTGECWILPKKDTPCPRAKEKPQQDGPEKRFQNAALECNLKNDRIICVHLQGKPFNITIIQVYAPTTNTEEAEVEQFCEDLQDFLELTCKKDVLFIIGD